MYGLPPDLLNAVAHAPDDDTPRLACADWLDEHDEPRAAALVRESVARSATVHGVPDARWGAPFAGLGRNGGLGISMRRGFPFRVTASGPLPSAALAPLAAAPMIAELTLRRSAGLDLGSLAGLGLIGLRRLRVRDFGRTVRWADLEPLLALPRLLFPEFDGGPSRELRERWNAERHGRGEWGDNGPHRVGQFGAGPAEVARQLARLAAEAGPASVCLDLSGPAARADLSPVARAWSLRLELPAPPWPLDGLPDAPGLTRVSVRFPAATAADLDRLADWLARQPRLATLGVYGQRPAGDDFAYRVLQMPPLRHLLLPPRVGAGARLSGRVHPRAGLPAVRVWAWRWGYEATQDWEDERLTRPWAEWRVGPLSVSLPARLGAPTLDAEGVATWREWDDAGAPPHELSPAVVRLYPPGREPPFAPLVSAWRSANDGYPAGVEVWESARWLGPLVRVRVRVPVGDGVAWLDAAAGNRVHGGRWGDEVPRMAASLRPG